MPDGSSSQVVDGAAPTPSECSQRQTQPSTPNAELKNDMDGPLATAQRRHVLLDDPEALLNVFHSPTSRHFELDSPHCPTTTSWQDASTEPLMPTTFNRPSPHSPYGSPSHRLELARETRNPYLSPKRKHGPSLELVGKKQRTLALFTGDSWSDAPVSLVSSQSQPHQHQHQHQQPSYNPPTPFSQPKPSDKPSTRRDIFAASPGKENLPPLPPALPPPPKLNLLTDDLSRTDRTTLEGGRNDLGPIHSPVKSNDNNEQVQLLLDRKRRLQTELETLTKNVKTLRTHYQLVDKIGAGTFSAVYKAKDLRYDKYDNVSWEIALAPSHHKETKGASCVSQLITAFREHENVFLVMPYFKHDDFRNCYRQMNLDDIKHYLKSLLTALKHLHGRGILHRDIKPNNFLYNMELKSGMLIDFGLAQRQDETRPPAPPKLISASQSATLMKPKAPTTWERSVSATTMDMFERVPPKPPLKPLTPKSINRTEEDDRKPGYIKHDLRKSIKASRAGTRGFRAPEVLFSVTHQTVAIDIWSVGVILLSLLTGRYPFFVAHDEADSLIEIACLFGSIEMKQCAALHNRTFETNINTIPTARKSLRKLCQVLNTEKFKLWMEQDDQAVCHAMDFLKRLLTLDFRYRMTAVEALNHPFLLAPVSRSPSPRRRRYSRSPSSRGRRSPSYSRSRSYSSRSRSLSSSRSRSYSPRRRSPSYSRSRSYSSRSPSPRRRRRSPSPRRGRSPPSRSSSYRRRAARSPTPPPPVKPNRLVVTQLTRNVTKGHIEEIFQVYGPLAEVDFPKNRRLHLNTGRAFVEFETVEDAEKAICHMDGGQLDGQVVNVAVASPRPRRPPPRAGGRFRSPFRRGFGGGGGGGRGRDSYVGGGRRYGRSRSRSLSPPPRYRGRRYSRSPMSRSPSRRRNYSPSPRR